MFSFAPDVGAVHGDGGRLISGKLRSIAAFTTDAYGTAEGAFSVPDETMYSITTARGGNYRGPALLRSDYVVPTAAKFQPRAWGSLPCVYLGQPAS